MAKRNGTKFYYWIIFLFFGIGFFLSVEYLVSNKLQTVVTSIPNYHVSFQSLKYSLIANKITVEKLSVKNDSVELLSINNIAFSNIYRLTYFKDHILKIGKVICTTPTITICEKARQKNIANNSKAQKSKIEAVEIDRLIIEKAKFTKENHIDISEVNTVINNISYGLDSCDKYDINYILANFELKNINVQLSNLEQLTIASIKGDEQNFYLKDTSIKTKVTKKELSQKVIYEQSHYDLLFPEIIIYQYKVLLNEQQPKIESDSITISNAKLNFFKDKRLANPTLYKPLYSEQLNTLPFDLDIPKINLNNASVVYESILEKHQKPGKLYFNKVNVAIGINTTKNEEQLFLKGETSFMDEGRLTLNLDFTNSDKNQFIAQGNLSNFKSKSLNAFMYNAFSTKLDGEINDLTYVINGNDLVSKGNLKVKYQNLNLTILNKGTHKVRKLLTSMGNFLFKNTSKGEKDDYREGSFEVKRDKTKSLFNFLWISLREGIIYAIT